MAENEQELTILVKLKDQATEGINKMSSGISKSLDSAKKGSEAFAKGMLLGGGAIAALGAVSLNAASDAEQAQTAFTTMLGSAEKAQTFIKGMKEFAAKTPFETSDISQAAQTMLSFGISSEQVMGNVQMLGDVALGNKEKFKSLALSFSQVQAGGKLMGGDLLQMIGQGFNPLQIISQKTGESMASLKEKMEKGAISADMVTEAFKSATSEGGLFYGGMEAQSKTFAGTMSTLKDNLTAQFQVIGEKLLPAAKAFVDVAGNFVGNTLPVWIAGTIEIVNWFSQHKEAIFVVAGAIMGALLPAMYAAASTIMTVTIPAFIAAAVAMAPFIIGGAIIGGLIAGILWIKNNWEMIAEKAREIWDGIANYLQGIWDRIASIFNLGTSIITGIVVIAFNALGIDIVKIWTQTWNAINGVVQTVGNALKGVIGGLFTWMTSTFQVISEPLAGLWRGMWQGMGSVVTAVWEGVKNTVKGSMNWIIEKINKVIRSINDVAAKGAGTLGISAMSISTIPMLAEGGIITRPTLVMAGEAGPEAIVPLSKGSGYGGGTTYVTVNINGGDQAAVRREVERVMRPLILNAKIAH